MRKNAQNKAYMYHSQTSAERLKRPPSAYAYCLVSIMSLEIAIIKLFV